MKLLALNFEYRPGDVEFEIVRRAELQGDVAAVPLALLLEQRRADQRRHLRRLAAHGDRLVAQHFDAVAADVALLIDAADQDAEGIRIVLPAEQAGDLRIERAALVRIDAPWTEAETVKALRSSGLRVCTLIVPPMPPSSTSAWPGLIDVELADDLGWQGAGS